MSIITENADEILKRAKIIVILKRAGIKQKDLIKLREAI